MLIRVDCVQDQLLINGRNHLALKNALAHQIQQQQILPGQIPTLVSKQEARGTSAMLSN